MPFCILNRDFAYATDGHSMTVVNSDTGADPATGEDGHLDAVLGNGHGDRIAESIRGWRGDRAAVVDEALKLDDLRGKAQVDNVLIGAEVGLDLQGDTRVAGLEGRGSGRGNRKASGTTTTGL